MEKKWWKESVVYQIYPRSFKDSNGDGIGDINGITSKLDYLKELGIDVIWLSPVYKSPNDDNGYDISDYRNIMDEFGTMEDFDKLLNEAHKRNIKILMDLVVNHTSDEHKWFVESRKSRDNKYRDYYIWREGKDGKEPNNWGSIFGGSAWQYDENTNMYYLHLFSKKQPDLNWENETVRNEIYDMMKWWLDKGIDGFRMDVISMISKDQKFPDGKNGDFGPYSIHGPRVHEFLKEMNKEVLSKYDIMTVGETAGVTIDEAKKYAGFDSNELNMVFQFEHMDLDNNKDYKWNDEPVKLTKLKEVMGKWQTELEGEAWNSLFWNNHDQPRVVSRFGNDSDEYREVSAKMLGTCLHMMKGTPYIYQGEELGMTNIYFNSIDEYNDIESINAYNELVGSGKVSKEKMMSYLRYKSRDNARTPMQWSDDENAGFTTGKPWMTINPNYVKINAQNEVSDSNSVFNYYKKLIKLRKENDIIVYGNYKPILEESEEIFAYIRELENKKLLVLCNFTKNVTSAEIPAELLNKDAKLLISNYSCEDLDKNSKDIKLKAYEARVYYFN
ncbi:glycoside hydrolase family 13 protein [Clostridium sp. HCP1S3_B4]|uniref:glycoside hydrolase family 13 protein n=1 Tax=unclassified Clostridium TaxID=2614128 RepID=UPI002A7D8A6B|nr:alpha-glucosidase [Clostridiales bacterium]MDY2728521.1 alpha-glucosidase [Clostridium sp.]